MSFTSSAVAHGRAGQSVNAAGRSHTKAGTKAAHFIKKAAEGNDATVAMAKLGIRKTHNPKLKNYCEELERDHLQANERLKPLAKEYGVSIKDKSNLQLKALEKENGAKFDRQFAETMLKDHHKAIRLYERAIHKLQNPAVKRYAETTLPVLERHFQNAETVAKAVGVAPATISRYSRNLPPAVGGVGERSATSQGAGARRLERGSNAGQHNPGSQPFGR